ncbi:hypothetical protein M0804_002116 [Polistes exclamans]|nr:hypothetical protein M0804_002116 [Polistes exclamans]
MEPLTLTGRYISYTTMCPVGFVIVVVGATEKQPGTQSVKGPTASGLDPLSVVRSMSLIEITESSRLGATCH